MKIAILALTFFLVNFLSIAQNIEESKSWYKFSCKGNCKDGEGILTAKRDKVDQVKYIGKFKEKKISEGKVLYGNKMKSSFTGEFKNGMPSTGEIVNFSSSYSRIRYKIKIKNAEFKHNVPTPDSFDVEVYDTVYTKGLKLMATFKGQIIHSQTFYNIGDFSIGNGKGTYPDGSQVVITDYTKKMGYSIYKNGNQFIGTYLDPQKGRYEPVKGLLITSNGDTIDGNFGGDSFDPSSKLSEKTLEKLKNGNVGENSSEKVAEANSYCVVYTLVKKSMSLGNASTYLSMVFIEVIDNSKAANEKQILAAAESEFGKSVTLNGYTIDKTSLVKGDCRNCKKEIIDSGVKLDDFRILYTEINN